MMTVAPASPKDRIAGGRRWRAVVARAVIPFAKNAQYIAVPQAARVAFSTRWSMPPNAGSSRAQSRQHPSDSMTFNNVPADRDQAGAEGFDQNALMLMAEVSAKPANRRRA